ncbi:MAG: DMT family transporter [Actinobacteria bacterium]|nr:DMT family transporter [Actinomycetota bacterium]
MSALPHGSRPLVLRLLVLAGVVVISFSAILVRLSGESPVTVAFFRAAYALPFLVGLGWLTRREPPRTWRQRRMAFGAGLALAVDFAVWHASIEFIGAGLATVLGSVHVVIMMIAGRLFLGQRPTRVAVLATPVALLGVIFISGLGEASAHGENPALGTILGISTGFLYVTYLLLLRQSSGIGDATSVGPLTEATAGAAIGALLLAPLDSGFSLVPSWPAHGWLLGLALGAQILGWLLITYALPRMEAWQTSVMLVLQPAGTVLWAFLLLGEVFSTLQWIGLSLVVGGVTAAALSRARSPALASELAGPGGVAGPATPS